jgi:hypothetical protein
VTAVSTEDLLHHMDVVNVKLLAATARLSRAEAEILKTLPIIERNYLLVEQQHLENALAATEAARHDLEEVCEYCGQHGIRVAALDYWRRAQRRQQKPKLVKVSVEEAQPLSGFALVLANGRRIESSWSFVDSALQKLIRVAEG